jgi:hypothetical protein
MQAAIIESFGEPLKFVEVSSIDLVLETFINTFDYIRLKNLIQNRMKLLFELLAAVYVTQIFILLMEIGKTKQFCL